MNELPINPIESAGFRWLAEALPEALLITNAAGQIVLANAQAAALFGYTSEALLGKAVEQLMPERFRAAHVGQRATYNQQPQLRASDHALDLWGLHQAGHEFPIDVYPKSFPTAEGLWVVLTIQDITARKRTAEALRHNEERWRTYLEAASDLIFTLDLQGLITAVNRAVCETLDYTAQELVGKSPLALIPPEAHREVIEALLTIWGGGRIEQMDIVVIARNGQHRAQASRRNLARVGKKIQPSLS